jgi:hypothetical protein
MGKMQDFRPNSKGGFMKNLKKFLIVGIAVSSLLSLSACSSVDGTNNASTASVTNGPPSEVPFPDSSIVNTDPTPIPPPAWAGDVADQPAH